MQNPLQITYHDMAHNGEIEDIINEKFEKIVATGFDITKCHVVLEKLSKGHQKANAVCVRLDLKVSHYEDIVVRENCVEDPAALTSAVLKVFKQGSALAHKHKKRRIEKHRTPAGELPTVEPAETEEE